MDCPTFAHVSQSTGHHIAAKCKGDSHNAPLPYSADLLWSMCSIANTAVESIRIPGPPDRYVAWL